MADSFIEEMKNLPEYRYIEENSGDHYKPMYRACALLNNPEDLEGIGIEHPTVEEAEQILRNSFEYFNRKLDTEEGMNTFKYLFTMMEDTWGYYD